MIATLWRRPLPVLSTPVVLAGGVLLVALAALAERTKGNETFLLASFLLLAFAAICYLGVWTQPAVFLSLTVAGTLLSGYSNYVGLPLSPDRIMFAAAMASLILGLPGVRRERQIIWRPVHLLVGATIAYVTVNAWAAGTLFTELGFFGLLDRLGVVPMLAFVLAPLIFPDRASRDILLNVLICVGAYLSITAVGEQFGIRWLVWPGYILDPAVGIHFGRVRGPFGEAVAMGLALYGCAAAGGVAVATWEAGWRRRAAGIVAVACTVCTIFTLTRAVWVATVVATVLTMMISPVTRRLLTPVVVVGAVGLLGVLTFVPGLAQSSESRANDEIPVWERYATAAAAIRAAEDNPLFGNGWNTWLDVNIDYLRQGEDYPLTPNVAKIEVHNVFLGHLADLGITGIALWLAALGSAFAAAILRPGPADLDPWRAGMIALAIHWGIVGMLGPLSYPFPNLLLWLWAGIAGLGHLSAPREST